MIKLMSLVSLASLALSALMAQPAWAYVGPGVGLSMMSSVFGLGMTALTAAAAVFIWPIKRWWRNRRNLRSGQE